MVSASAKAVARKRFIPRMNVTLHRPPSVDQWGKAGRGRDRMISLGLTGVYVKYNGLGSRSGTSEDVMPLQGTSLSRLPYWFGGFGSFSMNTLPRGHQTLQQLTERGVGNNIAPK